MGEISSCVFSPGVHPGAARIAKGDELGYFQYGGSTVCCIFRPGAIEAFALSAIPEPDHPHPPVVPVGDLLARAAGRLWRRQEGAGVWQRAPWPLVGPLTRDE